jgi:transcriptional regulator with XRE-family HTH domain
MLQHAEVAASMSLNTDLTEIRLRQANLLASFRRSKGMTQAQLAKLAGVTPQQISKYESARDSMSAPIWELMTSLLGGFPGPRGGSGFAEARQTSYVAEASDPTSIAECVTALRKIADRLEQSSGRA